MASRLQLHNEFINILGTREQKVSRVYFQAPEEHKMEYPCIKYSLAGIKSDRADDINYNSTNRYEIIVMDYDPDSDIHNKLLAHFPMCSLDRAYAVNGLHHKILTLYY